MDRIPWPIRSAPSSSAAHTDSGSAGLAGMSRQPEALLARETIDVLEQLRRVPALRPRRSPDRSPRHSAARQPASATRWTCSTPNWRTPSKIHQTSTGEARLSRRTAS